MFSLINCAIPLMSLPIGVLAVILRHLDPASLFNAARAWKPFQTTCRKDEVLSNRIRQEAKKLKSTSCIQNSMFYHQTPILRQRDRSEFKIPRVRLYHVILEEERKRGGEKIKMSKNAIRYQPYNKTKGIRI